MLLESLGSTVISPTGVWERAPPEIKFGIGVRARRLGAAALPDSGKTSKPLFFGQQLNFSGISQQSK